MFPCIELKHNPHGFRVIGDWPEVRVTVKESTLSDGRSAVPATITKLVGAMEIELDGQRLRVISVTITETDKWGTGFDYMMDPGWTAEQWEEWRKKKSRECSEIIYDQMRKAC